MGGGDIKLAVVIGLFVGIQGIIFTIYVAIVTGALIGSLGILSGNLKKFSKLPFAPFLTLGVYFYCFSILT